MKLARLFIIDREGNARSNVSVEVRRAGSVSKATVYAANAVDGMSKPNPLTTDIDGLVSFYAPNANYDIWLNPGTVNEELFDTVEIVDAVALAAAISSGTLAFDDDGNLSLTATNILYQSPSAGAVRRGVYGWMNDFVIVNDFYQPTDPNWTSAINKAIDTGKSVLFPDAATPYGYVPSGKALAFGQTLFGNNPRTCRISKVANGDMFTMAAGSGLRNIGLQGNGTSGGTGRGLVIGANTSNITLDNVNILDMLGYCVEVTADGGGSQLRIIGGLFDRTDTANAALLLAATDTAATPRIVLGAMSTGVLIDTGNADNLILNGIFTRSVLFGASSKKVVLTGSRIASLGGTTTIKGVNQVVVGNAFAGPITLDAALTGSTVTGNVPTGACTDNSPLGTNKTDFVYSGSKTYDPASIANGGFDSTTVTCTGAALGMTANASLSISAAGVVVSAYVSAADTVTVRYQNNSGGAVDLASHTLGVSARPPAPW